MLTLDDAKEFLRIDHSEEDGYISVLLLLAKEMCENYMRKKFPRKLTESMKQAMLIIISHFYENRDGTPVPKLVFRLLDPYRYEVF